MNRHTLGRSIATGCIAVFAPALFAEGPTTVSFRLIDGDTGRPTPAMVCITGTIHGEVRVPPRGEVSTQPSRVEDFYRGVNYNAHPNWIGPIRRTMGACPENNERAFVYGLAPSIPYWREPVMYQTSGDFSIDLPAGRWRVAVEHGPEYIPVFEEFELAPGAAPITKTLKLERWIDLAKEGWWSGDVHVHHPSLEIEHCEYLLEYARACNLHVVNLLEMGHHKGTDFRQQGFGREFRQQRDDYWLVSGQEDPRSTFGHIIGLNLTQMVRELSTYDFYDLTFKGIHEQPGALVGFAHLAWNGCDLPRGFPWYVTTGELDFIELLQFGKVNARDYYEYLNLGFRLTAAAGSDVPWGSTMGEVRTYVHTGPQLDVDTWFQSLKLGRTFVTNGPAIEFTVDGQLPGSELVRKVGHSVRIVARVRSHPKIGLPTLLTVVGNEGILRQATGGDGQTELTIELDRRIERSQWLAASAVCDNNAVAHSSPIYVVVDGRPTWSPRLGPPIIDKQLAAIANIEQEFKGDGSERGLGIIERLHRARDFYEQLRGDMRRDVPAASAQAGGPDTSNAALKIMSFNIRYGLANDGENRWEKRRDLVVETIRRCDPDAIGLQEALRFQLDEIRQPLPMYAEIGVGRTDGKTEGEYCAILYRKDRLQPTDQGTFWLSETPEVPGSKHWGNDIPRLCTWARFRVEPPGGAGEVLAGAVPQTFYLFNTHFDHRSQPSREKSAELLMRRIAARSHPEPVILTGDFNAQPDNPAIRRILATPAASAPADRAPDPTAPSLVDTFRVHYPAGRPKEATFHGWQGTPTGRRIDYIFAPAGTKVLDVDIVRFHQGDRYPSDHFPITATLKLPDAERSGGR